MTRIELHKPKSELIWAYVLRSFIRSYTRLSFSNCRCGSSSGSNLIATFSRVPSFSPVNNNKEGQVINKFTVLQWKKKSSEKRSERERERDYRSKFFQMIRLQYSARHSTHLLCTRTCSCIYVQIGQRKNTERLDVGRN